MTKSVFLKTSVLLVLASPAGAQPPIFAARSELVVLSATAVDGQGRPVTDLKLQELRVLEEGRPQAIVHFAEGSDVAARILILVDASGSMNGELKATSARMAATQVLAALAPQDEVALAGFDRDYWGLVGWTKDKGQVIAGFAGLKPFGSTALHDALNHAAQDLASHGRGRRAVVVITDGVDTASVESPDAVIARSRALDVPIYAVTVISRIDDPTSDAYVGRSRATAAAGGSAVLERYARLSGGAAFVVSDFAALQKAATLIAAEVRHQYRLAYDPPEGPPGFRRVEVRSTRKGILIRTRSGYVPKS